MPAPSAPVLVKKETTPASVVKKEPSPAPIVKKKSTPAPAVKQKPPTPAKAPAPAPAQAPPAPAPAPAKAPAPAPSDDEKAPIPQRTSYKHQTAGADKVIGLYKKKKKGGIIGDVMGLGKTHTANEVLRRIQELEAGTTTVLVIAPLNAFDAWAMEAAAARAPEDRKAMRVCIFHGDNRAELEGTNPGGIDIYITGIATLRAEEDKAKKNKTPSSILDKEYTVMVVDEAHLFGRLVKLPSGATPPQYANLLKSLKRTFTLAVTGTPAEKLLGARSMLELIGVHTEPASTLQELSTFYSEFMTRHTKQAEGVQEAMPTCVWEDIDIPAYVDPPQDGKSGDESIEDELTLTQQVAQKLAELEKYQRFLAGYAGHTYPPDQVLQTIFRLIKELRMFDIFWGFDKESMEEMSMEEFVKRGKIPMILAAMREAVKEKTKLVICSEFTSLLDKLFLLCVSEGMDSASITGSSTLEQRRAAQETFKTDPDCSIFFISKKAAGVAISLWANKAILTEPNPAPSWDQQAAARVQRLGQGNGHLVNIITLVGPTIDKAIKDKQLNHEIASMMMIKDSEASTKRVFGVNSKEIGERQAMILGREQQNLEREKRRLKREQAKGEKEEEKEQPAKKKRKVAPAASLASTMPPLEPGPKAPPAKKAETPPAKKAATPAKKAAPPTAKKAAPPAKKAAPPAKKRKAEMSEDESDEDVPIMVLYNRRMNAKKKKKGQEK